MAGERLTTAELTPQGLAGDRIVHVSGPGGRIITARARPGLLGLHARLGADGQPLVDGLPWPSAATAEAVKAAAGPGARLIPHEGPERFDVLPLLVGTDGAFAELGVDHRRLRPNIVIGGVEGLAERDWPGHRLRIGKAVIAVAQLRARCVMTTYDPDTQEQDLSVLRRIVSRFGGRMALDCSVLEPGWISIGDPVELVEGGGAA